VRKIKLDGVVKTIDISDGIDGMSFGMNGAGGMTFVIDGKKYSDNCFCENKDMLDGKVNFTHKTKTINCSWYEIFEVDDQRLKDLQEIHKLNYEQCKELDHKKKIKTVLFGLKYQNPLDFCNGYRFGKEITYGDFCITFDKGTIVVYKSSHNGYIAPDYLILAKTDDRFKQIYSAIKKSVNKYFGF
jgi:hypothetical protein